jgi:hypothetical protein
MGFISFKPCTQARPASRHVDRPSAVSFRPASCAGTYVGGILTLAYAQDTARTLKVCMTWDALDRLRTELARSKIEAGDATILRRVLTSWGVAEYSRRILDGAPLPAEALVLTLAGGPESCEPRRLLLACGLLPPSPA